MKNSPNRTSLAGEFYAMSRLFLEGYEATLTLGNTKGIDILLYNPSNDKQFKVEVKTSTTVASEKLFGGKFFSWIMKEKHETPVKNLIYCFVFVNPKDNEYRLFLVPSKDVAKYCKWQHQKWVNVKRSRPVKVESALRKFRVKVDEKSKYEDNFKVFN